MNAKHFGVPQSRERMIFIGLRQDLGQEPDHELEQTPVLSLRDAIGELLPTHGDIKWNPEMKVARTAQRLKPGEYDPHHVSTFKLHWNRPSRTLLHDMLGYIHVWHPDQFRPLTLHEWRRIASFPDDFEFEVHNKPASCRQIGNCVPPLFMRAIARRVHELLSTKQDPMHPAGSTNTITVRTALEGVSNETFGRYGANPSRNASWQSAAA